MAEQERPLVDRVWEFTKDLSVKVSRKAEKHWKINTLRVEIASIKHRINVKYKELGRYVYESLKSGTLEEDSYKASVGDFFDELARLEGEIVDREHRIEILEQEMSDTTTASPSDSDTEIKTQTPHPPPEPPTAVEEEKNEAETEAASTQEETKKEDDFPETAPNEKDTETK